MSARPTIWIEVDDLLRYFDGSVTPTGIGRVQAEILPWLARNHAGRVAFCRVGGNARAVDVLTFEEVARLLDGDAFLRRHPRDSVFHSIHRLKRYFARRAAAARRVVSRRSGSEGFAAAVRPGDVLLNLGASWTHKRFARTIGRLKGKHGIRFGLLLHDLLPVSHPRFVALGHIPTFTRWLQGMAEEWDLVLTPSKSSAAALGDYAEKAGLTLPPVRVIPFGAGWAERAGEDVPLHARTHVLFVSTIEIRKNHALLFRIWQKLIERHGAEKVPPLVFAGKYGWEIQELRQALKSTGFLGGKIKVMENLSDAELAALYRAALFTVFPSFCEGWGLPVGESLFHGRHCIASDATSVPEVGGAFADYHDPADFDSAYGLVEKAIFTQGHVSDRERRIREQYSAPSWANTAEAIVAAVDEVLR